MTRRVTRQDRRRKTSRAMPPARTGAGTRTGQGAGTGPRTERGPIADRAAVVRPADGSTATWLVTGGCGFIGSNLVHWVRRHRPGVKVIVLDSLTYAGNLENLADLTHDDAVTFVRGDVADRAAVRAVLGRGIDAVLHLAAESHVDRSISDATDFLRTNVIGTDVLLSEALRFGVKRFLQVSTDEVYGSLGATGRFVEESPLAPSSPYSASKAAADLLALAYHHTHGLAVTVTRCSNNYGPYQFPEKMIPLMVTCALADQPLPVYGDGGNVRDWIHVDDHCAALTAVLEGGSPGEVYNIGGANERTNLAMVKAILAILRKPETLIRFVADRPGHDRRYAIDDTKLRQAVGVSGHVPFEEGLERTVRWYVDHRSWWESIRSGAYRDYHERMYGRGGRHAVARPVRARRHAGEGAPQG